MCGDYNLRREKRYVGVDVRFTPDGKIRPLAINYDKTRTYGTVSYTHLTLPTKRIV